MVVELLAGDFNLDDEIDHLKIFSRKRGVVKYKTLFNSVLTINGLSIPFNEESSGATETHYSQEKNEYNVVIQQDYTVNDSTVNARGIIKGINSNLQTITV